MGIYSQVDTLFDHFSGNEISDLIVKSTQHFHAGFLPVAEEILYVSAPGTGSMDVAALPYARVTAPLWPKVADPHAAGADPRAGTAFS